MYERSYVVSSDGNVSVRLDEMTRFMQGYVLKAVDTRSTLLRASDVLDEVALDKYSFLRDTHLQRRRAETGEAVTLTRALYE